MPPANWKTPRPLFAMMSFCRARSMPAMPMAASNAPMVVRIRHTRTADRRWDVGTQAVQRVP